MYLIVETCEYEIENVIGCYKNMNDALDRIDDLRESVPEDEIIGYDDDYIEWEDEYGSINTYQLIEVNENLCG